MASADAGYTFSPDGGGRFPFRGRGIRVPRLEHLLVHWPDLSADCLQVPIRRGRVRVVTERFVAAAHRAGLPVRAWTINDGSTIGRFLDLGVDGTMSDHLRLLSDVLRRHREASKEA